MQQTQGRPNRRPTAADHDIEEIIAATNLSRSQVLGKPDPIERAVIQLAKIDGLEGIRRSLPKGSRTEPTRFFAGLVRCARQNPQVAQCSLASLLEALKIAAQVDVVPGDGRAYLIPYKGEVQFMLGAHGMRDVIRRNSEVLDINDQNVYEGDEFDVELDGRNRGVRHKRKTFGAGREWIGAYATAVLKGDPRPIVEIIDTEDLEAIRSQSKASGSLAWTKFTGEMARAKVLRRIAKRLPMRPDDAAALAALDAAEFFQLEAAQRPAEKYRKEPIRATVKPEDVRASESENRGHDHAAPEAEPEPQEPPAEEPEYDWERELEGERSA